MKAIEISHSVDDPPKLFFWSVDEIVPFFVFMGFGVFTGRIFTLSIVGLILTRIYGRFLEKASEKYLLHVMYWRLGMAFGKSTVIPNSFEKEYIV